LRNQLLIIYKWPSICIIWDYEKLDPREMHLWYIWNEDSSLILKQKHKWNEYPEVSKYFHSITASKGYWRFWGKNYDLFNTVYYWKDKISYRVIKDDSFDFSQFKMGFSQSSASATKDRLRIPIKFQFKSLISKLIRPIISNRSKIEDILCCNQCNGGELHLDKERNVIICERCNAEFKVSDNIYYFQ